MSDLAEVVLQHVGQNETVDSLHLSNELQQDHQKIVGAIKSIQVCVIRWAAVLGLIAATSPPRRPQVFPLPPFSPAITS